jgi:AcrR family transcriptional regulator
MVASRHIGAPMDEQADHRSKILDAARALLAKGGDKFSIAAVCAEAGVPRDVFKLHFTGKAALMAALLQPEPAEPLPESKAAQEPGVSTPDAWLERRLRVFERALNALEARQEAMARDHGQAIADMEDKLAKFGMRREEMRAREAVPTVAQESGEVAQASASEAALEPVAMKPAPERLDVAPHPIIAMSREEMAGVLQSARGKVRPVDEDIAPDRNARLRWIAIGALSLVALFLCVGLTFGKGDAQAVAMSGSGETHRHVAADAGGRLMALADAGNAQAQAKLALAYLKGDGVAEDKSAAARWSASAAEAGVPVAQYLLGALTDDKARAFQLFAQAAAKGNLKAMHNLAIAYAQGAGTPKDEAKAAEWFARAAERGYVDSAFDLAVLYERGEGVPQDLKQAMKWYAIAAFTGDAPSQARVAFLRTQMKPDEVRLAMTAASSFAPLPAAGDANQL